jgi:asparagine synthetase B (glutamine-hydrolysing)
VSGIAVLSVPGDGAGAIETMLSAAPHRGGELRVSTEGTVAVGVQRSGTEPAFTDAGMSRDRGLLVTVRGCLYRGSSILSGDEVAHEVARVFRSDGIAGVARLPGAFAAVVADGPDRILAARSPLDGPPLFWRRTAEALGVACEVKQLRVGPFGVAEVDTDGLVGQVALDFHDRVRTSYLGISRLPAGAWVDLSLPFPEPVVWWAADRLYAEERPSLEEATAEVRSRLTAAVARRMTAETAVAMSGGLDSTAVAATAAPLHISRHGRPLRAVSAVFPDHPSADESRQIQATAAALGLELSTVAPVLRPFEGHAADAELHDGPGLVVVPDIFRALLDAARARGATALLDGFDGDSLFGSVQGVQRALLRRRRIGELVALARVRRRRDGVSLRTSLRREAVAAVAGPRVRRLYRRARRVTEPAPMPDWVRPPLSDRVRDRQARGNAESWRRGQVWIYSEGLELGVENWERLGLAAGVEIMHPLADRDLVEFCLRLAPEVKVARGLGKALVRLGFPELPAVVTERLDKPVLDGPMTAAAQPDAALRLVDTTAQALPGVDWAALARRLRTGEPLAGPEAASLRLALQADHLMGCTRTAFASAA